MKRRRAPPTRLGGRALAALVAVAAVALLSSPAAPAAPAGGRDGPSVARPRRPLPGTEGAGRALARDPGTDKRADRRAGNGGARNKKEKKNRQRGNGGGGNASDKPAKKRASSSSTGSGNKKKANKRADRKDGAAKKAGRNSNGKKDDADDEEGGKNEKKVKSDFNLLDIVGGDDGSDSKGGGRGGKNNGGGRGGNKPDAEPDEKYGGRGKRRDDDDDYDDDDYDDDGYNDDKSRSRGKRNSYHDDFRSGKPGRGKRYDDDDRWHDGGYYLDDDDRYHYGSWYDPSWGGDWCSCPDFPRWDNPRWRGAGAGGASPALGGTLVEGGPEEDSEETPSDSGGAGESLKRKKKSDHHNATGGSDRMSARASSHAHAAETEAAPPHAHMTESEVSSLAERLRASLEAGKGRDGRGLLGGEHLARLGELGLDGDGRPGPEDGGRNLAWRSGKSGKSGRGKGGKSRGGSKGGKSNGWWSRSAGGGRGGWHDDDWRDDRPPGGIWGWHDDDDGNWSKDDDWSRGSKGGKSNGWWSRSSSGGKGKWHDDDWHTSWDGWDGGKGSSWDWGSSKDWGSKSGGGRWWGPGGRRCKCLHDPTLAPTLSPTLAPSLSPTLSPSLLPTLLPTFYPTMSPTIMPVGAPEINDDGSPIRPIHVASPSYRPLQAEPIVVDVLSNDVAAAPFPNRLTVTRIVGRARNGRCTVAPLGRRVEYLPDRGYGGRDRCEYEACDSRDECGTATVFFDVMGGDEEEPTLGPTMSPTLNPSLGPTLSPSLSPTMSPSIFPTFSPTLTPVSTPEINNVGSRIRPVVVPAGETTELNVLSDDVPAPPLPNPLRVTRIVDQATYGRCQVLRETAVMGIDVTYSAPPDYTGKDSCSYRACDSRGQCGDAFIFVDVEDNVRPTPRPTPRPTRQPSLTPSINDSGSVLRPVPVAAGGTTIVNVLENDEAATGTRLSVTAITENATNGNCAVGGNGRRVEYTPDAGFSGRDSCEYEACDTRGACGTARVYVRVVGGGSSAPTPSAPVTAPIVRPDGSLSDPIELPRDGSVTVAVLDNDTSAPPPPNPLTVTGIANQATFGLCTVQDGGKKVRYVPNQGYTGPDGCVYRACDTRNQCGEATVSVSVNSASAVPTYAPSVVPTGKPVSDTPTEAPSADPTPIPTQTPSSDPTETPTPIPTQTPSSDPTETPTLIPTQEPSFIPTLGPSLSPNDASFPTSFPTAEPSISPTSLPTSLPTYNPTVSPPLTPEINPDFDSTAEDTPKFINVLFNDQVAPGGGKLAVTLGSESNKGGNCTQSAGLFIRYSPPQGFVGTDECSYTACDELSRCGAALITITVIELSDPPTLEPTKQPTAAPEIVDDEFAVLADVTSRLNVLENDEAGIPPDGNSLRVISGSLSDQGGTCVPNDDGEFIVYAPLIGFTGVDRCTYEACDVINQCGTAAISISVQVTGSPSISPTLSPTESPTYSPTLDPSNSPTYSPTLSPTVEPTFEPSVPQSESPTRCDSVPRTFEEQRFEPVDGDLNYEYGSSISLINTTGFIGAPGADGPASIFSGAVYARDLRNETADDLNPPQKVTPEDPSPLARFGSDIDAAGTYLIVGSPDYSESGENVGQAEIFQRDPSGQTEDYTSLGSIDHPGAVDSNLQAKFGTSVAVAADGGAIAVGSIGDRVARGTVYIFDDTQNVTDVLAPDDVTESPDTGGNFGWSVDMNSDGTLMAVGAPFQEGGGKVYIFRNDGQGWTEYANITTWPLQGANDEFGFNVVLSDNSLLVVGARNAAGGDGKAYLYSIIPSEDTGSAEVVQVFNPIENGGLFGTSVAINAEGTRVVVGNPNPNGEGNAHLYYNDFNNDWKISEVVSPSVSADGTEFGYAVGVSTETLLVGSRYNTVNGERSGSAWAYVIEEVPDCVKSQPTQDEPSEIIPETNLPTSSIVTKSIAPTPSPEIIIPSGDPTSYPSEPIIQIEASTPTFSPTFTPTVSPTVSDLPPLPRTRFLAWSLLSANQLQIATDLGYTEESWNLLGSADIEHLTFFVLDSQQRKAVQSLGMITEDIWDCHINHYHGYFWSDLVESSLDQYYSALGWTKANWEEGSREPNSESKYWAQLTPNERSAARQLCYTEEIWDEWSIPDWS